MLIDFLKMDYDKLYTYLYDKWDEDIDTKTSATGTRMLKVLASVGFMNVVYVVKSFKNAVFSEATDRNVIVKKARSEKGYKALPVVSAYVSVTFSVPAAAVSPILIPKGTQVSTQDLTTNYTYTTIEDAVILVGSKTTNAIAVEGSKITLNYIATGSAYEVFEIKRSDVTLREMEVFVNGTKWDVIDDILDATSTSTVWTYEPADEGKINIMFGNGAYGKKLSPNDNISVNCLISAGLTGIVKANSISKLESTVYDATGTTISDLSCTNLYKAYGGSDKEDGATIITRSQAKYKSNWGLVSLNHYSDAISARQGVDRVSCKDINTSTDVPFRQVWCYMVDSNGDNVQDPYKTEVEKYVATHGMIGTEFKIKPVLYTNYTITIDVWIHNGYNSSSVIQEINSLINTKYSKQEMPLSTNVQISDISSDLANMDGVANFLIVSPKTDIVVPKGYLANAVTVTVNYKGVL